MMYDKLCEWALHQGFPILGVNKKITSSICPARSHLLHWQIRFDERYESRHKRRQKMFVSIGVHKLIHPHSVYVHDSECISGCYS